MLALKDGTMVGTWVLWGVQVPYRVVWVPSGVLKCLVLPT